MKKDEIVNYLKNQKIIKNNIYNHTWLSGCSTEIYPITVWKDEIVIQLKGHKNYFKKFLVTVQEKFKNEIKYCCFVKNDGSCPSTLNFKLNIEVV